MNTPVSAEFVSTRVLDAPLDRVWAAFTTLDSLRHWWGPKGTGWGGGTLDMRPGGMFHYGMKMPDETVMWGKWAIREIEAPHRLCWVNSFSDAERNTTRHPMAAGWPLEMLTTVTLEAQGKQTAMTLRSVAINATAEERAMFESGFDSMTQGFAGTWDRLVEHLAGA